MKIRKLAMLGLTSLFLLGCGGGGEEEVTSSSERYTITWVVGDQTHTQSYRAGAMPSYNELLLGIPSKDSDDPHYRFEFNSTWYPEIVEVSQDATYTAQFDWIMENEAYKEETFTTFEIPEGVTHIGASAFSDCLALTSITLPSTLKEIGVYAFYNCKSLSSFACPSGVSKIGNSAFRDCISLTSFAIPDGVSEIGFSTFYDCSSLKDVTIGQGLTEIGDYAFKQAGIEELILPDKTKKIGIGAFEGCSSLRKLTSGKELAYISVSAFDGCASLEEVSLNDGLLEIESFAFSDCYPLSSIIIPDSVISVGELAFSGYSCSIFCEAASMPATWEEGWNNTLDGELSVYWYSETAPESGDYWHYVNGVPTIW